MTSQWSFTPESQATPTQQKQGQWGFDPANKAEIDRYITEVESSPSHQVAKRVVEYLTDPKKIGRLAFQGIGSAVGASLTSPGIITTGVGGALGFATGDQLADIVFGERLPPEKAKKPLEQLKQAGKDIGEGLIYEAGGQAMNVVGKGLYAGERAISTMRKEGIKPAISKAMDQYAVKKAGQKISEATTKEPLALTEQIEKNIVESEKIEKKIPGLKFGIGEKGGDPNLLSLARQKGQEPGAGVAYANEAIIAKNEALTKYIDHHIRRNGNIDDFLGQVEKVKKMIEATTAKTKTELESEALKLVGRNEQEIGRDVLKNVRDARNIDSIEAKRLYAKVPDSLKIDATPLWNKTEEIFGSFDVLTQRLGATPTGIMSRVKEAMKPESPSSLGEAISKWNLDPKKFMGEKIKTDLPPELTVKQLRDFRSQVSIAQREAVVKGDYELAYNLGKLKDGVNETMAEGALKGEGEGFKALRDASDFWKNTYVPKYRFSPTGEVLGIEKSGQQSVLDSVIAGQYFTKGKGAAEAADNYKLMFGKNKEAMGLIKEYASQDLLKHTRNPVTGELDKSSFMRWLASHDIALSKYGLKGEFSSFDKALKIVETAKATEAQFNKSSLEKALNVDPDKAINELLMTGLGRKQSVTRMKQLVSLAKQDQTGAALEGLRAGIGDHFKGSIQNTARDLAGNKIESIAKLDKFMDAYRPALKESGLYTKEQLEAFENVHKAVQIISRQQRPNPAFGGSPTFELFTRMGASAGSMVLGQYGAYMAFKSVLGLAEKPVKDQINMAMARAIVDPVYAGVISGLAANIQKMPAQKALEQFNKRLEVLGTMAGFVPIKETVKSYMEE